MMMNDERQPLEFTPLPGVNAQERQQAAREPWRLEEEWARMEEERQRAERARQEDEQRRAQDLEQSAQREQREHPESHRTPTAADGLFAFLRHPWGIFGNNRSSTSHSGAARPRIRPR